MQELTPMSLIIIVAVTAVIFLALGIFLDRKLGTAKSAIAGETAALKLVSKGLHALQGAQQTTPAAAAALAAATAERDATLRAVLQQLGQVTAPPAPPAV